MCLLYMRLRRQFNFNIRKMKPTEFLNYETPQVEIIEVEVENGFAVSTGDTPNDFPYGGDVTPAQ